MNILHCFHAHSNTTDGTLNWAYRLIANIPEVQNFIASRRFLKNNFHHKDFKYFEYPLNYFTNKTNEKWLLIFNKVNGLFRKIYPYERFIKNTAKFYQVQLFHSHFAYVGWEYQPIAKKLGVPHVISFYGFDYEKIPFKKPIWKERYQILFQEADAFVCEGSNGADILEKAGCLEHKIHIVKLGVDVEKIPFYQREKPINSLKLVQIAVFNKKKGHIYTLMAFKKALDSCPDIELTFIGSELDDSKEKVVRYVEDENVTEKVKFIDAIEYDHIHNFLKDYDVFIHPSHYTDVMDCEGGAPIVLLDAQTTGMPVISTLHCDIPDEVIDGVTGLLAGEKNVDEICAHIKTFYDMNNDTYQQYSNNARKHIEQNYNAKNNSNALRSVYQTLIN